MSQVLLHRLLVQCPCGGYITPNALYVSDQKHLVVEGFCIKCTNQKLINIALVFLLRTSVDLQKGKLEPTAVARTEETAADHPILLPSAADNNDFNEEDRKLFAEMDEAFRKDKNNGQQQTGAA